MIAWSAIEVDRVEGGRATVARHAEPRITRKTHPLSSDSLRKMAENAARNGALSVGAGEQVGSVAPQIGHAARDLLRLPAVPVRRDIGAVVVAERSHRMRPLSAARQATMAGTGAHDNLGKSEVGAQLVALGAEQRAMTVIVALVSVSDLLVKLVDLLVHQHIGDEAIAPLSIALAPLHMGMCPR